MENENNQHENNSNYQLSALLNDIDQAQWPEIESFLDIIECPSDFRCLQHVLRYLEQLAGIDPMLFQRTFNIPPDFFDQFTSINKGVWPIYTKTTPAKGWMSSKPLYALLLTLAKNNRLDFHQPTLQFIAHYFTNENIIKYQGREESSLRAFRLIVIDRNIKASLFDHESVDTLATYLQLYRESIMRHTDAHRNKNIEAYLRDLEHFYRLDWKERHSVTRASNNVIRAAYSRKKKMEYVLGTDALYTMPLNSHPQSQFNFEGGLSALEDLPALSLIKEEPEQHRKPTHEIANIALIKDRHQIQKQQVAIQQKVRRAHNITPQSRTVLQPHELYYLLQSLFAIRTKPINGISPSIIQRTIFFILYTGNNLGSLLTLRYLTDVNQKAKGIIHIEGKWFLRMKLELTASRASHWHNNALYKTKDYIDILLPHFFVAYLCLDTKHDDKRIFPFRNEQQALLAIQQFLESLNRRQSIQICYRSIQYFLTNKQIATLATDSVLLECLTGESNYYNRSKRHYIWRTDAECTQLIWTMWDQIKADIETFKPIEKLPYVNDTPLPEPTQTKGIGSQFTPMPNAITELVAYLYDEITQSSPFTIAQSLCTLIQYHNAYTLYTVYMLLNASGYRAVHNPLPSIQLHLLRYHALCISDKDANKCFAHTRIIAIPTMLKQQLDYYIKHLNAMGHLLGGLMPYESKQIHWHASQNPLVNLLRKQSRIEWFFNAKHSRGKDGLFLALASTEQSDDEIKSTKNMSPSYLFHAIPKPLRLPINFGRHYIRRYLQTSGVSQELIDFQLGHWVHGELPLSHYSAFQHQHAISELIPHLNNMMETLGWKATPSRLTRKRI